MGRGLDGVPDSSRSSAMSQFHIEIIFKRSCSIKRSHEAM